MTPAQVKGIVEEEIGGNWEQSNLHGVDLKKCIVVPRKIVCLDSFPQIGQDVTLEMWIVLEEIPDSMTGYMIVFSEQKRSSGWQRGAEMYQFFWAILAASSTRYGACNDA